MALMLAIGNWRAERAPALLSVHHTISVYSATAGDEAVLSSVAPLVAEHCM